MKRMKKKKQRWLGMFLVLSMFLAGIVPMSAVQAATKTVETQTQLDEALKNTNVTKIMLKTEEAGTLSIAKGNYSSKTLSVNTPNATITNKGLFASVTIQGANNFYEYATDNSFNVPASASVKKLILAGKGGVCQINVNGFLADVRIKKGSTVIVNGKTAKTVTVRNTADNTDLRTAVKTVLKTWNEMSVRFVEGAEQSSIVSAKEELKVAVINETTKPVSVKINAPKGKQTIEAGTTMQVGSASLGTTDSKEQEETVDTDSADYGGMLVAQAKELPSYGVEDYEKFYQIEQDNPVDETFYQSLDAFSYETMNALWKNVQKKAGTSNENILYSPLSMYYALAMATEGARGETEGELLTLLRASDREWLAEQCNHLYQCLYRNNEACAFRISNSLWAAQEWKGYSIQYQEDYLNTVIGQFYGSLFSADFASKKTGQEMSRWVSEQTGGLLAPDFPVSEDKILSILNTIYLKDSWSNRFYEEQTKKDDFHLTNGSTVSCDFMNTTKKQEVFKGSNYTRASLALQQNGSFVFVLPDEGVDMKELLADSTALKEAFCGGESLDAEVTWQVPKFSGTLESDWTEILSTLGLEKCFSETQADLSGICQVGEPEDGINTYISNVRQGTRLVIDENGVEAAAYTEVAINALLTAMPEKMQEIKMCLTRPFLYAIQTQDGVYTFIGVCQNPLE